MSNLGIFGCDGCNTTAGRQGCPIHRDWTVPTLAPEMHVLVTSKPDLSRALEYMAILASNRYDRILELEREVIELQGEVQRLRDSLEHADKVILSQTEAEQQEADHA